MLTRRFYYALKPYLPWGLRMGARRLFARRQRVAHAATWPINEATATAPVGWPGWPEGKQFACVVTHDVECAEGLAKCRQLAEIDMEMGFRSSFNFVPEGDYAVPAELRDWLLKNGFEVGIHDLAHDGKLFNSDEEFTAKAGRINGYLRDWGATGFRAGFMLRNLDWYHQLDIAYDASTFDTDPFEPQPSSAGTIFPHWIAAPEGSNRPGYLELPYTLPQDSTLFLLLREQSPAIWLRKLDWVAAHGGMALVNVHPDYICFDGEKASKRTYPVAHYRSLLAHLRDRYIGRYWQPLPRQLATFASQLNPRPVAARSRRICMITHSFYESDNRVTRYAEALAARGDRVDVLALRRAASLPQEETIGGVRLHRLQDRFSKTEKSRLAFLWPIMRFLFSSSVWLTRQHLRERYDLVHVHNIPDFLIFAAWYPKLTGTPVVLDIHDIVPEFYASKFGRKPGGFTFRLLKLMERASAAMANHVIVANHLWLETYMARTGTRGRCMPFINYVDAQLFTPQPRRGEDGKLIVIFPGGLQWHQGLDIAIRAFVQVRDAVPQAELHIYGDGNAKESLVALTRELGLDQSVRFFEPTNVRQIASIMAQADLGVVPKRADSFGNEAYSTKIMEFMAVGVPAVVSSTKIDRYYFDESVVRFFPSGDVDALAREIIELLRYADQRRKLVEAGLAYVGRNCWDGRKQEYLALVDRESPLY